MPAAEQFAANLAMMFADSPFLDRFQRAADGARRPRTIAYDTVRDMAVSSDK
jgi:hydroxypyruvate isomerase